MSVARFWRKQPQRYNLIGTRCEACGRYFFPPRSFCPDCRRAGTITETELSGNGTVVTHTVIRSASDQFAGLTPYVIGIVELEEGPRMTAQIVCDPGVVYIGMPVKKVFRRLGSDGESGPLYYGTKFVPDIK
jgi:uncharacterized OB-fold protein